MPGKNGEGSPRVPPSISLMALFHVANLTLTISDMLLTPLLRQTNKQGYRGSRDVGICFRYYLDLVSFAESPRTSPLPPYPRSFLFPTLLGSPTLPPPSLPPPNPTPRMARRLELGRSFLAKLFLLGPHT